MAECADIVSVTTDENRLRDLGGMLDRLRRNQIADVVPIDAFVSGDRYEDQLRQLVHCALRGDHGLVEFGAKDGQLDILDLHFSSPLTVVVSSCADP
jgi:hypothetical protein